MLKRVTVNISDTLNIFNEIAQTPLKTFSWSHVVKNIKQGWLNALHQFGTRKTLM